MRRRIVSLLVAVLVSCLASAQLRFDYFYIEAEKFRLSEDYTTAAELYRHCLDINPQSAEALYNLGIIHLYLREDSIGMALLRRATELAPGNPWYLESLASLYLDQRDTENVIPVLERMAAIQTRRSDVLDQLSTLYHTVGQTEKAIEALNRIELLEGKSAQLSVDKATLYGELNQKDKADAELQSLIDEFPHDMNTKVLVGNEYRKNGQMERAWDIYKEVLEKEPTNAFLQLALLDYYQSMNDEARFNHLRDSLLYADRTASELRVMLMRDYIEKSQRDTTLRDSVMKAFDAVLSRPQSDIRMLTLKAAYQSYIGKDEEEVMETMHELLEVEPGNQWALSSLLKYYASKNDFTGMEDICRRGMNYRPEELGYPYYLALALGQQDKTQDAIDVLCQGLRTKGENEMPSLVSDIYSVLGDLYAQQKRTEEAFAAYDSALVYMEDNPSVLNNYAYYLSLRNERLDRAEQMSYRAIKAEPDNLNFLDTYAWILFMKEDYASARIYIDKVVSPAAVDEALLSNPDLSGLLIEHAGDIYMQCGQTAEALRYWRLAEKKGDDTCTNVLHKKIKRKKYLK